MELLKNSFFEVFPRLTIGVVGEGSDCFGFDDDISNDHDMEVGFCIWMEKDDYIKYGEKISDWYLKLLNKYYPDQKEPSRKKVYEINDFFSQILHFKLEEEFLKNDFEWMYINDEYFAHICNGEIFYQGQNSFMSKRNLIKSYYPYHIKLWKLAKLLHDFSQNGQYNYARMMYRKDYVTANICISQCICAALRIVYVLNDKYYPYYKWLYKGSKDLKIGNEILTLVYKLGTLADQSINWENIKYSSIDINRSDQKIMLIEEIAAMINSYLKSENICFIEHNFLDEHSKFIINKIKR